jgi:Holliday junction resolvase-like predicted endonuclease
MVWLNRWSAQVACWSREGEKWWDETAATKARRKHTRIAIADTCWLDHRPTLMRRWNEWMDGCMDGRDEGKKRLMRQLAALYTQKKKKKTNWRCLPCRNWKPSLLSFLSCLSAMMPNLGSDSLLWVVMDANCRFLLAPPCLTDPLFISTTYPVHFILTINCSAFLFPLSAQSILMFGHHSCFLSHFSLPTKSFSFPRTSHA